jgi:hypothetical protein
MKRIIVEVRQLCLFDFFLYEFSSDYLIDVDRKENLCYKFFYVELYQKTTMEWKIGCLLFFSVALPLWIILGVIYSRPDSSTSNLYRDSFRAIALAPFGAWIRWSFTKFPSIKAVWPEMNPHTLIANTTAVLLQSLLFAFAVGESSWVNAINLGKQLCLMICPSVLII